MANTSDVFGKITVKNIGEEFIDFLKSVQGSEQQAYYKLVELDTLDLAEPDEDNNLVMEFSTFGRWSYLNNLEGYLKEEWLYEQPLRLAYEKLVDAMTKKNGSIEVEYTDSDIGMDWMGDGKFTMSVENGEVVYDDYFFSKPITIKEYAEMNGDNEFWALGYIYGEEVAELYDQYAEECKKESREPLTPSAWYEELFEKED